MSLIPDFEIGLGNAWIFTLYLVLAPYLVRLINKNAWKKCGHDIPLNKTEKKISRVIPILFYFSIIYSIFLPLKLSTIWFYSGFSIYLLGVIFYSTAGINFATAPLDKPVTKGVYRISRNPIYLGMFFMLIGTGIACASWVFVLLATISIILLHFFVASEERFCLKKYGREYEEYMNRTPRWIGIPK